MAAPAVAGAVALLLEQEPELTNVEVKMRLKEAAVDTGMPKNCQGWGMPDLRRLLLWHGGRKKIYLTQYRENGKMNRNQFGAENVRKKQS